MSKRIAYRSFEGVLVALLIVSGGAAQAAKISGTIATTMTITEDSQLVGDVTCTVSGAPCIVIGAPGVTLDLNSFTMTGQGDPQTACSGGGDNGNEAGIVVSSKTSVSISGPGIIQRFRGFGIALNSAIGTKVTGITMSTNCFSGIIVIGGSLNELTKNISIRNGSPNSPCGGI